MKNIFAYHTSSPTTVFLYCLLLFFIFLHNKKPVELQFYGFLTFEYNAILR